MGKIKFYKYPNFKESPIHVGQLFDAYIRKNHINIAALARKIGRLRKNVACLRKKKTLQLTLIAELCYGLNHNFFAEMALLLPQDFTGPEPPENPLNATLVERDTDISALQADLVRMQMRIDYLEQDRKELMVLNKQQ